MKKALINYIKKPKFDDIYTPEYAVIPILKYLPKDITIWECCDYGESKITKVLRDNGYKVITSGKEENFFKYEPNEQYDLIITNPPYSLKDDFLERCYKLNKPFMLLLPLTSLEGIRRGKMFREHGIELIVFDKRIDFLKGMGLKNNNGNWFNTSWFCHNILKEKLIFEELRKELKNE